MKALALVLLLAGSARADAAKPAEADATTIQLVDYFLKTPTSDANPKFIESFLAVDTETLPKRQRAKAKSKQIEIQTLIKLHDTKKKGNWLQPAEGCTLASVVHPLSDAPAYQFAGYVDIDEDEARYVEAKTHCSELELACHFSLGIFFTKGKPRRLMLSQKDPLMSMVAESHSKTAGQTNFFGIGLSCAHTD
jgi:hypothetical protein